jgi:hypothetical protein
MLVLLIEVVELPLQEIIVYLTRKLNQKPIIWTFGQFDHLVKLDKLI